MATIVKIGESQPLKVRGKKIKGFTFALYARNGTANTANLLTDSVPNGVVLNCELKRGGRVYKIFADRLGNLHAFSNLKNAAWNMTLPGAATGQRTLVAKTTALKEQSLYMYSINTGVIDVEGDDELTLNVQADPSCITSALDSTSFYQVDTIECNGEQEIGTPIIDVHYIEASVGQFNRSLGDHVSDVVFLNLDQVSQLAAAQVVQNYSLASKNGGRIGRAYYDVLTENHRKYVTLAEANARYQTLELYEGGELEGAELDIQLNSANVAGSKCMVVVRRFVTSAALIGRANAKMTKKQAELHIKYGVGDVSHAHSALQKAHEHIAHNRKRLK